MEGTMEDRPPLVPRASGAKQGGEARARWAWAEPSVWTDRMLEALERGVKGGVWYSLMDKVCSEGNLESAWSRVERNKGGPGVDGVTVAAFGRRAGEELARLSEQLRDGTYEPQAIRRSWIPKGDGGQSPLGIPTVRDRVVQTALRNTLEPVYEHGFAEHSYGFRPRRGAKDALRRVDALLKDGHRHVVDADIRGYFDSIPKVELLARMRAKVADGRVLALLGQFLDQSILEGLTRWTAETGTPQGAVISPLLANVYLDPLDHLMADGGIEMVRYADDFVLLCRSAQEANAALDTVREWMEAAGLTLHPDKTRIVSMDEEGSYFDFLGYRFKRHKGRDLKFPRPKSEKKLRESVRKQTRRTNANSLEAVIGRLNPVLRGWFEYFKHCHQTVFPDLDGYVRMRLRSILRKRNKKRGRGRGSDHQRWPNAYFTERGLFSLVTARAQAIQPLPG